ncbi:MAG: hypothetical protein JWQ49_6162 [Edaphobacter sp.]|nr:hypothetical protein [Edaphobacter sp.]
MHLTGLDLLFWAASFFGHVALLVVLFLRRRARTFPLFTTFICANILRTISLYLIARFGTKATYFYTYWYLAIFDVGLQLGVVYELASGIFRPVGVWTKDIRRSFVWLGCLSVAVAAALAWLASPSTRLWMQSVMIKGNLFSAALMSELFVSIIALSVTVGLPWRTHITRIAQGLGVYSIIDVLLEAAHSYFGLGRDTRVYEALSHMRIAVYLACITYWIIMLWREAPQPRELPEQMRRDLLALQERAEYSLQSLRSRRE